MFSNSQIEIKSIPTIENVVFLPISKSYLKIIIIRKLVAYSVLCGLIIAGKFVIVKDSFQWAYWYAILVIIVCCIANFTVALLAFKTRKYALREQDIIYAEGLLIHAITTVPISRIQHIETSRSWLSRQFNLSSIKIFTAGESGTDLCIRGLPKNEAKHINDFLSARVNGND